MSALSAPAGHLPLEGKATIQEYPLLKRHRSRHPVRLPAPPYRHPERSRGIFIARPLYAHMRPHSNDTLVLPLSPFPHPRFTGLQERSLHFGRDDRWKTGSLTSFFIPLRGSILRLWRAPSLRGYSYRNITPLVPKHATYLPDESPSAPRIVILSGRKRPM